MASTLLTDATVGGDVASGGEDLTPFHQSSAMNCSLWTVSSTSLQGPVTPLYRSPLWDFSTTLCSQASAVTVQSATVQEVVATMANYKASLVAWRYGPPVILTLGTIGNLMTLWVLGTSSGISPSMAIYFRALAVSDLVLLYSGLLRNWIKYTFHMNVIDVHPIICKVHFYLIYVTVLTSAWFLVMMSAQRALLVVWPQKMRLLHSRRAASITVAAIVIFSCVLNTHNLHGYDVRYNPNIGQYLCGYVNSDYKHFAQTSWPWIDMSLSSLLPFVFLVTSNSLLMWKVTSSIGDVKTLTSSTGRTPQGVVSQRQKMSTSLNVTLISLSVTFLLLTSPICVNVILDNYFQLTPISLADSDDAELIAAAALGWALTNLLWYANSAVNFYLYCLTGSRFRRQVWQCLCCVVYAKKNKSMARQE